MRDDTCENVWPLLYRRKLGQAGGAGPLRVPRGDVKLLGETYRQTHDV
jgi:hypothetical protein